MDKLILEKITKIIDLFLDKDNNYKNSARTWEVGTNFYQSLNIGINKIKGKLFENAINYIEIKRENDISINKCEIRYKLLLNGKHNVTPSNRKSIVSESAVRQYLQAWFALEIINIDEFDFKNDNFIIYLNNKIWDFINYDENELVFKFLRLIPYSYFSKIDYVKNMGFSIFLSLIDEYNNKEKINYFNEINCEFKSKRLSRKYKLFTPFNFKDDISQEYIKHVKGEHTKTFGKGKDTYFSLCKNILDKYEFNEIINSIYNALTKDNDDSYILFNINSIKEKNNKDIFNKVNNYVTLIKDERYKLRREIINHRISGFGCNKKQYSDIINSMINIRDIESMQACHIYEVEYIIKDLKLFASNNIKSLEDFEKDECKKQLDQFVDDASNYNNGIFMCADAHKMFDKHYVWFDTNGKFHSLDSKEDEVIKSFGEQYKKIEIKSEVLTDRMKQYIEKRMRTSFSNKNRNIQ